MIEYHCVEYLYISSYAATVGAKHFHASAKLNKGIDEIFLDLSKRKCRIKTLDVNVYVHVHCMKYLVCG